MTNSIILLCNRLGVDKRLESLFIATLTLFMLTSPCQANDIDMQQLQHLLELSDQMASESSHTPTHSNPHTHIILPSSPPPTRVLIDVRSNHSDGKHDMTTLITLAEKRGIESMAFTEHDRFSIRFGIDPVPQFLGYAQQHPSLYTTGLQDFFTELHLQRQQHPEIQLFGGTESIPGYHWSGIPFQDLTLHDAERHIITLGIESPAQVEALSSYDLRYGLGNRSISIAFWCASIFILVIFFLIRGNRGIALLLIASLTAFMATWLMKPKVDADVAFIQSAQQQGLFTIWAHPGTLSGVRPGPMGVQLDTPPYSRRVFKEPTADAFAAVYGDTDLNTLPSGLWDRYLLDYLHGYHAKPIWATAAGDYHEEGMANEYLGNFVMDVWSKSSKPASVLEALQAGHMVAWGMGKQSNIATRALFLKDAKGQMLQVGDEASVESPVQLVVALQEHTNTPSSVQSVQGSWIVDGHIVQHVNLQVGSPEASSLTLPLEKGEHVIRFQISQGVRMVANPFLVHVK